MREQGEGDRKGRKADEGCITKISARGHRTSEKYTGVSQNCSSEGWQMGHLSIGSHPHWLGVAGRMH